MSIFEDLMKEVWIEVGEVTILNDGFIGAEKMIMGIDRYHRTLFGEKIGRNWIYQSYDYAVDDFVLNLGENMVDDFHCEVDVASYFHQFLYALDMDVVEIPARVPFSSNSKKNLYWFRRDQILHELLLSNKMSANLCQELGLRVNNSEILTKEKLRDLVICSTAYYLFSEKPAYRWKASLLIKDPLIEHLRIRVSFKDHFEGRLRTAEDMVKKKVIPEKCRRRRGGNKTAVKYPDATPEFPEGLFPHSNKVTFWINFQALRVFLRVICICYRFELHHKGILMQDQDRDPGLADAVLNLNSVQLINQKLNENERRYLEYEVRGFLKPGYPRKIQVTKQT